MFCRRKQREQDLDRELRSDMELEAEERGADADALHSLQAYGVAPNDPWSFIAAVLLMAAVGSAAAWIPARRATKVDPMVALRNE